MAVRPRLWRSKRALLILAVAAALAIATALVTSAVFAGGGTASAQGPCDIYAAAGIPCVAAHSTTRALYAAYNGPLYQVKRASDGATTNIGTLSAGGYANAAAQDSFCAGTYCTITQIYDQSGHGNNLTIGPAGGNGGADIGANAAALPVLAGGHKVYGVDISPGMGYRDDHTSGVATGSRPQGAYMVTSGTNLNGGCCFDYGNAETNNDDNGNGHMDAVYFGTLCWFSPCAGPGPWVQADLENGLFSGGNGNNPNNKGNNSQFVTALVQNNGTTTYAIKGGNADSGSLTTWYSGALPAASGYAPMEQEGAIILGVGGDNSNSSAGSFFEGVMTAGYPTDAADNAVQANIVSVGYANYTLPGNPFAIGSEISLRASTPCCTADYLTGDTSGDKVGITSVTSSSSPTLKADATWIVEPGLVNSSCISFKSANGSGDYLRQFYSELYLEPQNGTAQFAPYATFCPRAGNSGSGYSFMPYNYGNEYIRDYNFVAYIASDGGSNAWDASSLWPDDTTWLVASPWG
jgi:non-reducing end alpha-L-arabinofuranosidase